MQRMIVEFYEDKKTRDVTSSSKRMKVKKGKEKVDGNESISPPSSSSSFSSSDHSSSNSYFESKKKHKRSPFLNYPYMMVK